MTLDRENISDKLATVGYIADRDKILGGHAAAILSKKRQYA